MIDLVRISDLCDRLGLGTMATHLPHVADEAGRNEFSFVEFFERLLQSEHFERQERSRTLLTRAAGFPAAKTLEQYDFSFATGAPKPLLTGIATLTFIERAENVVLLDQAVSVRRTLPLHSATKRHNRVSRPGSFRQPT